MPNSITLSRKDFSLIRCETVGNPKGDYLDAVALTAYKFIERDPNSPLNKAKKEV
jgi:hypothetical protein